ncbi:RPM1-interacting protein 4-like [Oryza brachyantha]|uniref:RIN4 pathogenic type III effector avirulence factor Avr cleavage site domain-containing protein n=1 Tax=Oryza brachyantha TaxID=4533 RepID=J3LX52_ORYBR|nr:RPM1-interacting protein 4-like [Oryza brachyantha]
MAQSEIPAFGSWDTTGNTPYTQKFENARKNKKPGISSHPNDPRRHPEPPTRSPLHPAYTPDTQGQNPLNPPHGRRHEADPHRRHSLPQRDVRGSAANAPRSPYRMVPGSASPAQPSNPSKPRQRAAGMHTPERRSPSEGQGQHTPRRSRMKQGGRGYDMPEDDVAVPPFGEWDESNAASGEKFTGIFNRVRDDKLSPNTSTRQPDTSRSQANKVKQTCPCCIL